MYVISASCYPRIFLFSLYLIIYSDVASSGGLAVDMDGRERRYGETWLSVSALAGGHMDGEEAMCSSIFIIILWYVS